MAESPKVKKLKGWFLGLGRGGDRTIDQQMLGLEKVVAEVAGKTVLDAGCAEGLISMELAKAGAVHCVGLELVPSFVAIGNAHVGDLPCKFFVANLNDDDVGALEQADIVLMLAILHKLKDPTSVCTALAGRAKDLCVIRLPPYGPVIVDQRSNNEPHDIDAAMKTAGFTLESVVRGPFEEWVGYYRRVKTAAAPAPVETPPVASAMARIDELSGATADTQTAAVATETPADATPDASSATKPAEGDPPADAKPPEQAAAEEADRVAETGDTTPSVDPTEPPPNQGEGIHTGQPLPGARRTRAKKVDDDTKTES
jgi:hypothetical protein